MNQKLKMIFSPSMLTCIWDLLTKYLPTYLWVAITRPNKQCWLITERPTDARDNGYVLFKWLCQNHPEKNVIYAIRKNAADYANVANLGKVIEYGSYQHWYYYFAASICCDTSWGICCPNSMTYLIMRNVLPPRSKRVFLQHGITKDYMPQGRKRKLNADIFVCGAYPEWKYINTYFGYTNGEVKYLGFARYDRLCDTSDKVSVKQILYMPTWRAYLRNDRHFEQSQYYQKIKEVLTHYELYNILEQNNLELIYFVHPSIRERKRYFEPFANSRIKVLNNEDYDLQKLICSASLLITDFSSIYFDFAYQKKPVIYYHFDYQQYRKEHYSEGYFNYERDGFGPIVYDLQSLVKNISSIVADGFNISDEFSHRSTRFFPVRDCNNCLRHYEAIYKLEKEKRV